MSKIEFSFQLDAEVFANLRDFSTRTGHPVETLITEAVREYLQRARLRPAFGEATEEVVEQHDDLLRQLAR